MKCLTPTSTCSVTVCVVAAHGCCVAGGAVCVVAGGVTGLCSSGCGFAALGCAADSPHLEPLFFSAWTSTSCPPHGTLCGWLLPGPCSVALPYPAAVAIWPAVLPLPYFFVWSDEALAYVSCFVVLDGLTPFALLPPVAGAEGDVSLCFDALPWPWPWPWLGCAAGCC